MIYCVTFCALCSFEVPHRLTCLLPSPFADVLASANSSQAAAATSKMASLASGDGGSVLAGITETVANQSGVNASAIAASAGAPEEMSLPPTPSPNTSGVLVDCA